VLSEEDDISKRIKQVRNHLGYAQKYISELAGCKLRTWQTYEDGKSIPGGKVLAGLSRLGVNVDWVLTGEGEMFSEQKPFTLTEAQCEVVNSFNRYKQTVAGGRPLNAALNDFVFDFNSRSPVVSYVDGVERISFDELSRWVDLSLTDTEGLRVISNFIHASRSSGVSFLPGLAASIMDSINTLSIDQSIKSKVLMNSYTAIFSLAPNLESADELLEEDVQGVVELVAKLLTESAAN